LIFIDFFLSILLLFSSHNKNYKKIKSHKHKIHFFI